MGTIIASNLRHAPSPSGWVPSEFTFALCSLYANIRDFFCYPHHYVLLTIIESLRASVYQYVLFSEAYFREGVRENPLSRGRITPKEKHTLSAWL